MEKSYSIRTRFNVVLLIVYVSSLLITLSIVYFYTKQEMYNQANQKLTLMVDMVSSVRKYITEDVRPALLKQNVIYPPAISSTVATGHIAVHFKKLQPDYYIKTASDNPLNVANRPEPIEQDLLDDFRKDREQKIIIREGSLRGQDYLFSSHPTVSKAECMVCHSTPEAAPEIIRTQYTSKSGFGYKLDDVVGVSVVGVPLENIKSAVLKRSIAIAMILTSIFTLMLVLVNMTVHKQILKPLDDITAAAQAISKGKLDTPLTVIRNDEIGKLTHAIELMRRSFVKVMERMNRK
jgi:HAMP domain-containing protein